MPKTKKSKKTFAEQEQELAQLKQQSEQVQVALVARMRHLEADDAEFQRLTKEIAEAEKRLKTLEAQLYERQHAHDNDVELKRLAGEHRALLQKELRLTEALYGDDEED
jgi:predicted  nucleic acid-binding Zn-ribbon protein